MPTDRPYLTLLLGSKKPARVRIDEAFAETRRMAEDAAQWAELLYGPGGGPPPAPEQPSKRDGRPVAFREVP
jgi:hypothetical protein